MCERKKRDEKSEISACKSNKSGSCVCITKRFAAKAAWKAEHDFVVVVVVAATATKKRGKR